MACLLSWVLYVPIMGHCQIFFRSSLIARRSSLSPIVSRPSPVFPFFPRPTSLVSPAGGGAGGGHSLLVARPPSGTVGNRSLQQPRCSCPPLEGAGGGCSSARRNGWKPFPTTAITCLRCRDCSVVGTVPRTVRKEKRRARGPRPTASSLVSPAGGGRGWSP